MICGSPGCVDKLLGVIIGVRFACVRAVEEEETGNSIKEGDNIREEEGKQEKKKKRRNEEEAI